ncbi:MAG: molybdate ABC transporter substrate-binding protein [Burkholderiales bacterium]|nr:molybdate ABC transporter substrate-binding protein [Burkholderiales bacterium]
MTTRQRAHNSFNVLRGLLIAAATLIVTSSTYAAEITVFAAASLKESLDEQIKAFSAKSGHTARVAYAGSNALAKQIEAGAPAELFIAADEEWMDYLAARKLIIAASRRVLVGNELVLIAPVDSKVVVALTAGRGAALREALGEGRLAVANPDTVPAGKYARVALTTLDAWRAVESRLARSDNVRSALAFVARGEAPLGIVYRTDAIAEPRVRVVAAFSVASHPPIAYRAALVAGKPSAAATELLDYLGSAAAQPVWQKHGFRAAKP